MNLPRGSDTIDELRWRWRRLRIATAEREGLGRRVGVAVLACLVVLEIGLVGYQIGSSSGVEESALGPIRGNAFEVSFEAARTDAKSQGQLVGRRVGALTGRQAGKRSGAQAGERRGSAAVERAEARIARQEAQAAALTAAALKDSKQTAQTPAPVASVPAPAPAPAPAPSPSPSPAPSPTPQTPEAPCFDAAGHPC